MVSSLDILHRKHTKGIVAQVIEKDYFGIPTNSYEDPDFRELKIELKVSPLKIVSKYGIINAKERNVIGMVDYYDIYNNASWHDNKKLSCKLERVLFVFYLHEYDKAAVDWRVLASFLWSPNKTEDLKIQKDYDIIRDKIINGIPNSERHNTFLATCPKHAGGFNRFNPKSSKSTSICKHPTMNIAEKRGFCIRNIPVTRLVAEYGTGCRVVKKGNSVGIPADKFSVLVGG